MCLAVPLQVIEVAGRTARVSSSGVELTVALDLIAENVAPGDYLIVHAGFALQVVGADEAAETLAILARLGAPGSDVG